MASSDRLQLFTLFLQQAAQLLSPFSKASSILGGSIGEAEVQQLVISYSRLGSEIRKCKDSLDQIIAHCTLHIAQ